MGDWVIATWWGTGPQPTTVSYHPSDGKWAMRTSWAAPGLWQVDTCMKYGFLPPAIKGSSYVGVVPAYGNVFTGAGAPFPPGFNYLWAARPRCRELIDAAAVLGGAATVVEFSGQTMLCLPEIVEPGTAEAQWSPDALDDLPPSARPLVEALFLAVNDWRTCDFLIGLWTPAHGYLHTGGLTTDLTEPYPHGGEIEMRLSGEHQPVTDAVLSGPYAHSIYFEFHPRPLPQVRWPLQAPMS